MSSRLESTPVYQTIGISDQTHNLPPLVDFLL